MIIATNTKYFVPQCTRDVMLTQRNCSVQVPSIDEMTRVWLLHAWQLFDFDDRSADYFGEGKSSPADVFWSNGANNKIWTPIDMR